MTNAEILYHELQKLSQDLAAKHRELGMRASGQWESELEVETAESRGKLTGRIRGLDYTVQLSEGRAPGRFPPVHTIEQWIEDKGIAAIERDISVSSLAFLIARKIAREGTRYYQQGGTDLLESVVTPDRIEQIISKVGELHVDVVVNTLLEKIRELSAQ